MEKYNLTQTGQEVQNILNNATPQSNLAAEVERAQEAERLLGESIQQNADDIDALEAVVPSGATSDNKLATESYVNDAVATSSATFRGTFNLVSDLHLTLEATHANIATALVAAIATADNNDFAFVLIPVDAETPTVIGSIERYKFNGNDWAYEYTLNNSGFTQAQYDAINSGITSNDVNKLAALPTNAQLTTLLNGKQDTLTFDNVPTENSANPVKSGGVYSAIKDEETRAKAAEKANADDIDAIEEKIPSSATSSNQLATASDVDSLSSAIEAILLLIPSAASSLNQLADKAFVNSSIATATATFRGTYNLVNDLGLTISATHAQIATALGGAILTSNNNDYAFVQIPTSNAMPTEIAKTERYKFNGTAWEYEYDLNNSGFTADQWSAINSGITQALVTKLAALPTNAELTTELGTLISGIITINQKIPNAASQANKLVDNEAMESYIVEVLNVLTVSYNVTSTDGHVTLSIEQVDGKVTSVTLTTSDIASAADLNLKASQADLTALSSRVTTAEGNITSLGGRVSTNETDIAQLQAAYEALTQSNIIIGALPASGVANKIYRVPGTSSYSDYMWNGSSWVLMATYNNAIDPRPKKASQNLVTSGGVFDNMGALDVSELNATENPHTPAIYADLSAALAAISTDYQKGGMSIKFVQSSDNNYVEYFLTTKDWSINVGDWMKIERASYMPNFEDVLFNTLDFVIGGLSTSDGSETIASNRVRTDYITLETDCLYFKFKNNIWDLRVYFYDNSKTFISSFVINVDTIFYKPSNAAYVRFISYNHTAPNPDIKYQDFISSFYVNVKTKMTSILYDGKSAMIDGFLVGKIAPMYNNGKWSDINSYWNSRNVSNNSIWTLIDNLKIKRVSLSIATGFEYTVGIFDSEGNLIFGSNSWLTTSNIIFGNISSIRLAIRKTNQETITPEDGNSLTIETQGIEDVLYKGDTLADFMSKYNNTAILYHSVDDFQQGSINNSGAETSSINRWRTDFIEVDNEISLQFIFSSSLFRIRPFWYDSSKTFISATGYISENSIVSQPEAAKYVRFVVMPYPDTTFPKEKLYELDIVTQYANSDNKSLAKEVIKDIPPFSKLRVMSYNIGAYNYGTSPYYLVTDYDTKLANYKHFFGEIAPDVLFEQEYRDDIAQGISADSALYNNFFIDGVTPTVGSTSKTVIRSKYTIYEKSTGALNSETERIYSKGYIYVGGHKICILCVHLMPNIGGDQEAFRAAQMQEIVTMMANETHYIICGDFNVFSGVDEWDILTNAGMVLANGPFWGYHATNPGASLVDGTVVYPTPTKIIDNIVVSPNIKVVNFKVLNDYVQQLSSDHIAILADLLII